MENSLLYKKLKELLTEDQILEEESMSLHTTFRVGGPADFYVRPRLDQAAGLIAFCHKEGVDYTIIGNGSTLLVGDGGIRGLVIAFEKQAGRVETRGRRLLAQAGALLSKAAAAACLDGLGGLEFAAGIPGSVGGAVVMNAGAYGGEMKDIIISATVMDTSGKIFQLSKEELDLSYRHSCIPERKLIVLEAELELEERPVEEIKGQMEDLMQRRLDKQPLEYPSAGSTFKRPQGYFAGKLIMDAGLAGFQVGGAQVSKKHCGFVINTGNATAADILALIREVQKRVQDQFGVDLEPEVRFLGEFVTV